MVEAFFIRTHPAHLFLLTVLVLGSAALGDELLEDKPVVKGSLTIALPKNWKLDDRGGAKNILLARAPAADKDLSSTFNALLTVDSDNVTKLDGKAQQARLAKLYDSYKPTEEPTPITINGLEGVMFGGTFSSSGVKLRARQYLLMHNNRVYVLTFTALESAWGTHVQAIEACAASLNVKTEK